MSSTSISRVTSELTQKIIGLVCFRSDTFFRGQTHFIRVILRVITVFFYLLFHLRCTKSNKTLICYFRDQRRNENLRQNRLNGSFGIIFIK